MKGIFIFFILGALLLSSCSLEPEITDFESCVAAGFPVMESFPEQCRGPTGEVFVNVQPLEDEVVCTTDVLECANGDFVSRDPANNCEFRACTN